MTDPTGSLDDEVDTAWSDFRADLADLLTTLDRRPGFSLGSSEPGAEPYLRFGVWDGRGVTGEVLGNDADGHARLDSREHALLTRLGWFRLESCTAATHWNVVGCTTYDDLALMAERTLREVFDVPHPSFLHQTWAGDDAAVDEDVAAAPATGTELARMVDATLASVLGEPTAGGRRDDHTDIAILTSSTVVQVEIADDARAVDVHAVLVRDVADRVRALAEVNVLNRDPGGATYTYRSGQVVARQRIPAQPFVPSHLRAAVVSALDTYDELAGDLVARIGGRRWFSEPEEVEGPGACVDEEEVTTPTRLRLRTLMHLEADQPGSVEPRLAAHIFDYDARAILSQITWLRQDGRVSLVPLLRQALRVVVEDDRERSAR